ncbi:MAG: nucleotide exchange factor GrpE [Parcubacteria group bacterium]|nr:nucleotide exchange factor GrpE [Parcubacteria group bacterium]
MDDPNIQNKKNDDIKPEEEVQDDIVLEEVLENTGRDHVDVVNKIKVKLKACEVEKQEYLDGWQRAKAEFINIRKRDEEDKKEFIKFAEENLISELIPVLESFEMAKSDKTVWESVDKNWRAGVEHIHKQLLKVLHDNNLKEIDPKGEKFDPMRDEAISHEEITDESKDHVIIDVIQKGYSLNGKQLKAPRVVVGNYKKNKNA